MRTSEHILAALLPDRARLRWRWVGVAVALCLVGAAPASAAPFVYVTDGNGGVVYGFDTAAGRLVGLSSSAAARIKPLGVGVTPDGTSVYVVNFGDGSSFGSVSQYDVASDGTLSPKSAGPVLAGRGSASIAVNLDGKAAYVTNLEDGTVSEYDIGPGGALSPTIPSFAAAGVGPSHVAVSPNGKSVYVTDRDKLFQYSVGAGDTLTPKKHPTVATGHGPSDLTVSPDGKSAYVTDFFDGAVSQYSIGTDGALHPKTHATVATGKQPSGIAVSPDSQSVYVADRELGLGGAIAQYTASPSGLVLKFPQTIAAGLGPERVVVSPDGNRVYATDRVAGAVLQYSGGNGPGSLSALSPPFEGFGSGVDLAGIAIGPAQIRFICDGVIASCRVNVVPISTGGSTTAVILDTRLVRPAPIGILVQRLVGKRLVLVGRAPFGLKRTGHLKIRWNLRVGGHRLLSGRYLITLRMFDRRGHLIALAHPASITVK